MVAVDAAPATAGARVPVTVGGAVDATVTARGGVEAEADVVADTSAPEEVRDITRRCGLDRELGKKNRRGALAGSGCCSFENTMNIRW